MLELLWLLLPVAAASGWLMARRGAPRSSAAPLAGFSSDYFKGLNYLLNEQPDKAIEVFIRLVEVDNDTVETHMALGSLFRRRGEVDRAIRLHQNLIARPTLDTEQRAQALLELGFDYMRAGLLDRAESLFQELVGNDVHTRPALTQLVDIYQQEKDWNKAIEVMRRLGSISGQCMEPVIAQYYCECAEQARAKTDNDAAKNMLDLALRTDPSCVRASLIEGTMAMADGDYMAAIDAYRRVEKQDARFLSEIIEPLHESYRRLKKPKAMLEFLTDLVKRHHDVSSALVLTELVREQHGEQAAANVLITQLQQHPSLRGLQRFIQLIIAAETGASAGKFAELGDLIARLQENKAAYQCGRCGFTGRILYWQCPSCKTWNSVTPIQSADGR